MSTNKHISMLDELQCLLTQQLELARQGNSAGEQIETLGKKADCFVKQITQADILERLEFEDQKKKLKKLYADLHLALTVQKDETSRNLSHIHSGKRIIGTYRKNIQLSKH